MSSTDVTGSSRPARWGLAAKLFTTLVLLGAIAVLVTGVLGYFRARDALEKAVFDQLTAARQTKTRQVETYFRTIQAELRLLATSKMVVDATREFRIAVDQLDRAGVSPELRQKVSNWYAENFLPRITRVFGQGAGSWPTTCRSALLPTICSTTISSPIRIRRSDASFSTTPATAATTAGCTPSIIP